MSLASCSKKLVIDEPGKEPEEIQEEVVMTFQTSFKDFDATFTRAAADASNVDRLLVHVYEESDDQTPDEYSYDVSDASVAGSVKIPLTVGKDYKICFWAYRSSSNPYRISDTGLKGGVTVTYPDGILEYDALETFDAFYAVCELKASSDKTSDAVSLTRPFALVNLAADKGELMEASASKVEITIPVATEFIPGKTAESVKERTFVYSSTDGFQSNETLEDGSVYLGTTYLFANSGESLDAKVILYDSEGNILKEATEISIPMKSNTRTNVIFSGVKPYIAPWNDADMVLPDAGQDGWRHINRPGQLAAVLLAGDERNLKIHVSRSIDMKDMPVEVGAMIGAATGIAEGLIIDGGNNVISNFSAPAFLASAADLSISNLCFENVHIDAVADAGVIVNNLMGNSTFANVHVSNSSAVSTDGAAGGFVGKVSRRNLSDRAEMLKVTFDDCHLNNDADHIIADSPVSEGKFVGLLSGYDNAEMLVFTSTCSVSETVAVADFVSPYSEGNEGEWLSENDYTMYDGWLGDEEYYRGTVVFGAVDEDGVRFIPKWDGETVVTPLEAEDVYDGLADGILIYSPFDLAYLQDRFESTAHHYIMGNVDLGGDKGHLFVPIRSLVYLNGVKKEFMHLPQEELTAEHSNTIYNLKVYVEQEKGPHAAFIKSVGTNDTRHMNLNFIGADIYGETITDPARGGNYGEAYAGTLVATTNQSPYYVNNVHASYGTVDGACKLGGMIGWIMQSIEMDNCSIDNYVVKNREDYIREDYSFGPFEKSINLGFFQTTFVVYGSQWWYKAGEAGGLVGIITHGAVDVNIRNCSVTDTEINCTGQPNKEVVAEVSSKSAGTTLAEVSTVIAGRHVNQFVGDIWGDGEIVVTLEDYYVDGNSYHGEPASSTNSYNHQYETEKYCDAVGCAYYVGVDLNIAGLVNLGHVEEYAGTLKFKPRGGDWVTVVEPAGEGESMAWMGGSFKLW